MKYSIFDFYEPDDLCVCDCAAIDHDEYEYYCTLCTCHKFEPEGTV